MPAGAQDWTYFAQSELSSYWGYGSQNVTVVSCEAPDAPSSLSDPDPPPHAARLTTARAALAATAHVRLLFISSSL
jgi:hypothetical protein